MDFIEGKEEQIFATFISMGVICFHFLLFHCFSFDASAFGCNGLGTEKKEIKLTTYLLSAPQVLLFALWLPR